MFPREVSPLVVEVVLLQLLYLFLVGSFRREGALRDSSFDMRRATTEPFQLAEYVDYHKLVTSNPSRILLNLIC